ncbi:MAG: hypothetical protein S4CHLAM81_01140 [Chlamydiales bacterium]|nr:hypothetical protein [Chlamydiales bacterium]
MFGSEPPLDRNLAKISSKALIQHLLNEPLNNSLIESSANLRAAASFLPSLTRKGLASGSELPNVANLGRISNNRVIQYLLNELF